MLADLLLGTVALVTFLLPGWTAARWMRLPLPLLAGFVASAVGLLNVILVLQACSISLTFMHCGAVWLGLALMMGWFGRKPAFYADVGHHTRAFAYREHWPLFLVLIPAFAVVIYRATTQPLFGIDTVFRWNYLAQQMLGHGNLNFYPPVTADGYEIYAWPDGIAPAVSSVYFWIYALAGAARAVLTAPAIIAQYCLLVAVVFALARRLFSDRAAAFACALLACSPVIAWATAMGQETGFVALALSALIFYLPRHRGEVAFGKMLFAGLAAGLAGLAREYGLVLALFGFALALARRLPPRALLIFAATAITSTVPWYARNWFRTGNPLFDLDLGGLFPVNGAHAWLIESYQLEFSWRQLSAAAARFLFVNCAIGLLGAFAGAIFYFRESRAMLAAACIVTALWIESLGYTAAGFTTALRVLSPALVLAAVLGGAAAARWVPGRKYLLGVSLVLGMVATDAALRALTLPATVYKIPAAEWLTAGHAVLDYHERSAYLRIADYIGKQRILVLGPNAQLTLRGAHTVPLWSPEVRFIFDDRLTAIEIAHGLHSIGIGFILLNGGPANERYLAHSAYFRDPGETLSAMRIDDMMLLKIADDSAK